MAKKGGKRRSAEQVVKLLKDGEAMLAAGRDLAAVLQALAVSEATWHRWRKQFGGMKPDEAKRLAKLERENAHLKRLVADLALDNRLLKDVVEGNV
jgi:methylphosphotriester-DNA--protein-cysteine methyltransferase